MSGMRALARRGRSLARRWGLVSSPLRRRTDRIEGWLRVGLLAAFLIGTPLAAVGTGQWTAAAMTRTAQAQAANDHHVAATLLPPVPSDSASAARGPVSWVRARWTAPDGSTRTGQVQAPLGARAGSTVWVWTDSQGHLTSEPLTHGQVVGRVITGVLVTVMTLMLVVLIILAVAHRMLERRRLADWEQSWSRVEPLWNRRRR